LNLFAYTGSFTCYALAGGAASTTTVDISKTYCAWAKRNLQLNGFVENLQNQIVNQDCFVFLQEAMQQKRRYDLIICDPPTFSNSKKMQKTYFDINKDYPVLLQQCLALLKPSGKLIFSTNSRKFELDTANFAENLTFKEISSKTVPLDFRNKKIHRCWEIYK
jgi:23S rRNA G2069 N7-methylase RlmK/C1962 C5-methylase RlmI